MLSYFLFYALLLFVPTLSGQMCRQEDKVYLSFVIDSSRNVYRENFERIKTKIISDVLDLLRRNRTQFGISICRSSDTCEQDAGRCFYYETNPGKIRSYLSTIEYKQSEKSFEFKCNEEILIEMQTKRENDTKFETYKSVNIILTYKSQYKAFIAQDGFHFVKEESDVRQLPPLIYRRVCSKIKTLTSSLVIRPSHSSLIQTMQKSNSLLKTKLVKTQSLSKDIKMKSTVFKSTGSSLSTESCLVTHVSAFNSHKIIPTISHSVTGGIQVNTIILSNLSVKVVSTMASLAPSTLLSTTSNRIQNVDKTTIQPYVSSRVTVTPTAGDNIEQINKDINDVMETKDEEFKNENFTESFLQRSVDLIERSLNVQKPNVNVERFLDFLEDSYKTIGSLQKPGKKTKIKQEKSVVEISTFDREEFKGYNYTGEDTNIDVMLPETIFNDEDDENTVVVIMDTPSPFYMKSVTKNSISRILTVTTKPVLSNLLLEPFTFTFPKEGANKSYRCVFWNTTFQMANKWDTRGCTRVSSTNNDKVTCQCNHMTSFSLLVQTEESKIPEEHETALTIITYVGCGVSIFACISLVLLYLAFGRVMKYDRNLIHMNLCIAIALSNTLFLVAANVADHKNFCLGVSVSLLYGFLACFFWMLIEGIHVYTMVVKVFHTSNRWKMYMIIGWLCPAIIVSIVAARYHRFFIRPNFCWVSTEQHVIWSFVAPVILVILLNSFILIRTLRASHKMDRTNDIVRKHRRLAHLTIILLPIFGVTWIFGFFSINNLDLIFFQYIFNLLNSFQGLFIFIFYALLNNDIKREYDKFRRASSYFSTPRSSETTLDDISHKRWSQLSVKRLFKPKDQNEPDDNVFYLQTKSL